MKILFYCDKYPPSFSGGIGSVTKIVAEALVKRGHEVFVVGNEDYTSDLPDYSIINGVNIYRVKCYKYVKYIPFKLLGYVNHIFNFFGILSRISIYDLYRTEVFISHLIQREKIELLELVDFTYLLKKINQKVDLKKFSIPTIIRIHGSKSFLEIHEGKFDKVTTGNDKMNFRRAHFYCAVSQYAANFVAKYLEVDRNKIEVIFNPIDEAFLMKKRQNLETSDYILFIGKIVETKGAFNLIHAFNQLLSNYPDLKLVLVGNGQIHYAKSLVDNQYRDSVIFKGHLDRDEILNEIDHCQFAVVPSYFENCSMVALEIMARGKALVFTKETSGGELIEHGQDGLLVDPKNIDSIVDSMKLLLEDTKLRDQIGLNALKKIKIKFKNEVIIDKLESLYLETVSKLY